MRDVDLPQAFWSRPVAEVASALGGDLTRGLSSAEAARRLARYGPNALEAAHRVTFMRALLSQLRSPLVLLLVIAAAVSAVLHAWTDAGVVVAIVLGSALLGTWHEWRAGSAVEKLRASVRVEARVIRDGVERGVPAIELVPGDLVRLGAGSLAPGDALLVEAKELFVAEAVLTGESFPTEKIVGVTPADAGVAKRTNAVFFGTAVRSGTGTALVVHTGHATEIGHTARALASRAPETAFEAGLRRFGMLLMEMMIVLTLVVVAANVLAQRPAIEALLFALALAVGMSPELLPAILSVTLARGAMRMAEHGVIVKRLSAIETFGAMDVLCTDKTGTLTEGVVRLDAAYDARGEPSTATLELGRLNAELQTGLPSPLDQAIVRAAEERGVARTKGEKCDEIPYDFGRKRIGIVVSRDDARTLVVKGATSSVLGACASVRLADRIEPIAPERRALDARVAAWNADGYRVLAVATREVEARATYHAADECDLVLEGFLVFFDPPKAGTGEVVRALRALGIELEIVTGDSLGVAEHVARALEIEMRGTLTGESLRRVSDDALVRLAERTTIFAEVDPGQKERVIRVLRRGGRVVGYLGDGINDAAALHAADVAISVDGAVDVAKEAADFVLGRHDLDVLRAGVEAGRTTFANTLKYIRTTASANTGNMMSMAAASLWLPFLPLTATQILLANFLTDVPLTLVSTDAVDREVTERPARWDIGSLRAFMIVFGAVSSIFDLLTFTALRVLDASVGEFRTTWLIESMLTELVTPYVTRTLAPFWRSRPSRPLMIATVIVATIGLVLPYTPLGGTFGLVALSPDWLALIGGITALYLATAETVKALWWRRRRARAR